VPLAGGVFGLLYLIFGESYAPGLGAGFFVGYLVYDMMHYYLHHFRPRGWLRGGRGASHISHSASGGPAIQNAMSGSGAEPVYTAMPSSSALRLMPPLPNEADTVPCCPLRCASDRTTRAMGASVVAARTAQ